MAGGRARNYTGGRLYWSAEHRRPPVSGAILTKYLAGGGPAVLGFPTADGVNVTGGRASYFTGARIYWSSATGAHTLRGRSSPSTWQPADPVATGSRRPTCMNVTGGAYAHFTGSRSIFWSAPTLAHLVYGPIRTRYAALGYQRSCLGFPTTDRFTTATGYRNNFTGGFIAYNTRTGGTSVSC